MLARVAVGGLDADVFGAVGGATLDAGGRVDVFESDGWDAVGGATVEAGGRVGACVGVGGPGLDGRLTVGTETVGSSDLVGVGSPGPLPPEPHPAATTVISNAPTTATRMALPPQAPLRLEHYKACHGGLPMDRTLVAGRAKHLLGLLNQLPGSFCVTAKSTGLYMRYSHRRKGVGTALLMDIPDRWPTGDVEVVTFTRDSAGGAPARRLYERFGFLCCGLADPAPDGGLRDKFVLRRWGVLLRAPRGSSRLGISGSKQRHRHQEFLAFLKHVARAYPDHQELHT